MQLLLKELDKLMSDAKQTIECPSCHTSISIDDVLTHQIEDRIKKAITAENESKEAALQKQQREVEEEKQKLEEAKQNSQIEINKQVAEKIGVEKAALWKQAQAEADQQKGAEVKLLEEQLAEKDAKLREANAQEIALRKEKNKLEEDRQIFELEKQRQLDEKRKNISEEANKKAACCT